MSGVGVERRRVVRHFATREVPAHPDDPERETYLQRKGFSDQVRAWRWVARGSLFQARAQRCYCQRVADTYRGEPAMDGGPGQCRYCDPEQYGPVVARLARILRHRASHLRTDDPGED